MQILLVLQNLLKAQVKAKIIKLGRLHELQHTLIGQTLTGHHIDLQPGCGHCEPKTFLHGFCCKHRPLVAYQHDGLYALTGCVLSGCAVTSVNLIFRIN